MKPSYMISSEFNKRLSTSIMRDSATVNKSKQRLFVVLVSLAFWLWLAKDFALTFLIGKHESGMLAITCMVVLSLLLAAGRLKSVKPNRTTHIRITPTLGWVLYFLCYCTLSAFLTGNTAFTLFKLEHLLISIIMAYALAEKTVRAVMIDSRLFITIGLIIGIAGFYSFYGDLTTSSVIGLRARSMAHLNIQDCYVFLFLVTLALLLWEKLSSASLIMFFTTTLVCIPTVVALNSRMIPITIGITLVYLLVIFRSYLFNPGNRRKTIVFLVVIVAMGAMITSRLLNSESRMIQSYNLGYVKAFSEDPRSISFRVAYENFLDSPLTGIGFGKFRFPGIILDTSDRTSGTWPHNLFLELLSELGIVGFLLFVIFFLPLMRNTLIANAKSHEIWIVLPCILFSYVITTMQLTQNIFYPLLWLCIFWNDSAFRQFPNAVRKRRLQSLLYHKTLSMHD